MKPFNEMEHHPLSDKVVKILCDRTQSNNELFFRVSVAYYWCMIASMMRCTIDTLDRGEIPINMYAVNLSSSGTGKGFSTNILENEITHLFKQRYIDETYEHAAQINLPKLAVARAKKKGTDDEDELAKIQKEFNSLGTLMLIFDSATPAAVKQQRHKLLMANTGSLNLQIDEIGSNLLPNIEVINTFLELYDVGSIKQKLVKNTAENIRVEEIVGRTPANMLAFGTPHKLLDGGKIEEEFYSLLSTGYARRCFFGYSRVSNDPVDLTPEQVFELLTNKQSNQDIVDIATQLEQLADIGNMNRKLLISKETTLVLIEYKLYCEKLARNLSEYEEIKKAELTHRYFKALKLAGAFAFVDDSPELTLEHLYSAIKLAEESGEAFSSLLTRDRNYVKLAKYIATCKRDVTQADLVEDLPFYRGSSAQKAEMLNLAIAYGHKNNIIIKKSFSDGVEFLRGESLQVTNLSNMILAYSNDITTGYQNQFAPFDELGKLTQAQGLHWTSHHLDNGYRNEENARAGFNLLVIDLDGGVRIQEVKALMSNYKYHLYTTKRHTEEEHRFRLILPMNYVLKLDAKEYKEFMSNVFAWLPFACDEDTAQRSRKWLCHQGTVIDNDGELFDVLPFIPKTAKNEERKQLLRDQSSLDNLERWVLNNSGDGNRNNMLLRYALLLVEAGADLNQVREKVLTLNSKMPDKLDDVEILSTVCVTAGKAINKRDEQA